MWETVVLVLDVLQRWLSPVDIDGGHVDAPGDNILVVGGNIGNIEINLEIPDLIHKVGAGHVDVPPWHELGQRIFASGWVGGVVRVWCREGSIGVGED